MPSDPAPFRVIVRDRETGRGVPLITLELTNGLRWVTDNAGVAAINEPAFLNRPLFVGVQGPGYRCCCAHMGRPGVIVTPEAGQRVELTVVRIQPAERLCRLTGQGLFWDEGEAAGDRGDTRPCWTAGVLGQDSAIALPYRGRLIWFWGDTLGAAAENVRVTGATAPWPGADLGRGLAFAYFENAEGFVKPLCSFPGAGRIWLDWVLSVTDPEGEPRLVARYSRVLGLDRVVEQGIALFDDAAGEFRRFRHWPAAPGTRHRVDHPLWVTDRGRRYVLFTARFDFRRTAADWAALTRNVGGERFAPDPEAAEAAGNDRATETASTGAGPAPRCRWVPTADSVAGDAGLTAGEPTRSLSGVRPIDLESGDSIEITPGSIAWNDYLRRWLLIAQGRLGDIWLSCADSPVGPWVYCRKIAAHDRYSFYNPVHHPFLDQDGGRTIHFEGTFSNWFTDDRPKVPRYDYNQILYRLRLDQPESALPVPVYFCRHRVAERGQSVIELRTRNGLDPNDPLTQIEAPAFFAFSGDLPAPPGLVPVYASGGGLRLASERSSHNAPEKEPAPLFWALPAEPPEPAPIAPANWCCTAWHDGQARLAFSFRLGPEAGDELPIFDQPYLSATAAEVSPERIRLELEFCGCRYRLDAALARGVLRGRWNCRDTGERGDWSGTRDDFIVRQWRSPAVAPLFEYHPAQSPGPVYGLPSDRSLAEARRSHRPLCRVWRNPLPRFLPDLNLQPVVSDLCHDEIDQSGSVPKALARSSTSCYGKRGKSSDFRRL